jgi:uncharacterized protein YjbJ (UPF0337 family)
MKMTQTADWKEVKGKIKAKFEKLSDAEIEGLNGHMDHLQSIVQKVYAYTNEKAEKECKSFNETLRQKGR